MMLLRFRGLRLEVRLGCVFVVDSFSSVRQLLLCCVVWSMCLVRVGLELRFRLNNHVWMGLVLWVSFAFFVVIRELVNS